MCYLIRTVVPVVVLCLATQAFSQVTLTVAPDGSERFKTIQAAIDAIPDKNAQRCVIDIRPGTYHERVIVPRTKPFVTLRGQDPNTTIITNMLDAHDKDANGKEVGTSGTGTVTAHAHDFIAENLTFSNPVPPSGKPKGPALAMFADADRMVFRNCRFLGWQDTLCANRGRQYYRDCFLEGRCDYIFGNATAVFENCTLHTLTSGYITAQSRTAEAETNGYVFINCRLIAPEGTHRVFLGRPWRPYARVIFDNCWMGDHVDPTGWTNWGDPNREATSCYAEHNSTGPGANPSARVKWSHQLTDEQAQAYQPAVFLKGNDNWQPQLEAATPAPSATQRASQPAHDK